jgi:hypothetical protein
MNEETRQPLPEFSLEEVELRLELSTCFTIEVCTSPIPPRLCFGVKICLP